MIAVPTSDMTTLPLLSYAIGELSPTPRLSKENGLLHKGVIGGMITRWFL